MGLTEILWAKELLKSNNLGGKYSLRHIKGHKIPPRRKLKNSNIIANASPFKPVEDVSPLTLTAPVGSSHSFRDG